MDQSMTIKSCLVTKKIHKEKGMENLSPKKGGAMVASVACAQLTQLSSQTALRRTASSARISAKRHPSVARSSGVVVRAVRAEAAAGDADDRVETGRSGLVTKVASLVVTALASAVVALPAVGRGIIG